MFPSTATATATSSAHSSNGCPSVFGSQTGMPTWGFGQTPLPPLSPKTTFTDFGFRTSFGFPSPIGMSNFHGTSTWTFTQNSSPLSTPSTSYGYGTTTSTSGGSKIADYKRTDMEAFSAEKLVSISAMPVYKTKSHEELRWEDYNITRKGGFGLSCLSVQPTTSPGNNISRETTSKTPAWKYPGPPTTWSTSQPLEFSSSSNTCLTTPSNSFNPFVPRTTLTSTAVSVSRVNSFNPFLTSFSHPTFINTPSSLNPFWSTPVTEPSVSTVIATARSVSVSPEIPGLNLTYNQSTTLVNPFVPSTQIFSSGTIGQRSASQLSSSQISSIEQPPSATSPFRILAPKPQLVSQSTQSIQYGISSIPVKDKPALVRYPLLTTRNISSRSKLPVRKYDPKLNGPKIPFFNDTKEIPVNVFVPRENPRAMVISSKMRQQSPIKEKLPGKVYENDRDEYPTKDEEMPITILDIPLKHPQADYYTEPQISELEAKERADPGFCRHVKDFVVGRHGYGSIKFLGETDVRNLDLESHVQFNNREVIVYMDETKKPPVGEGLNKPAEITLLNIKCIDKKSGMQYMDGSKIDKYTQMLKKKGLEQGVDFISYDPIEGEWKFRVQHF